MKKYWFLIFILTVSLSCSQSKPNEAAKPNVVIILADDMGIGDVEAYNPDSKIPTPNMNTLAEEGMRFTNAHSPSSVCTPSRYGLLTGRYPWRVMEGGGAAGPYSPLLIDTARITMADLFKKQKYATAATGKWHLGLGNEDSINYFAELKPGPLELGFDYFFGMAASLNMSPHCFIEDYYTVGTPDVPVPDHIFSNHGSLTMTEGWRHEDVGPTITEKATGWLEKQIENYPDKPFFLYLPTSAPHRPCYPPDFIKGRSKAGVRGDMVAEVDWTVGEVVKLLKEKGVYENTILIVSSDNGAIGGNTPLAPDDSIFVDSVFHHEGNVYWRGRKTQIWEGGHRIPMIVKWPGKTSSGAVSDELVELIDWYATFADFFDMKIPENAGEDSYSLLPVITREESVRDALITQSAFGTFAVHTGEWKLILGQGSGGWGDSREYDYPPGQLYYMQTDSLETTNLFEEHPAVVDKLEKILEDYKASGRSNQQN